VGDLLVIPVIRLRPIAPRFGLRRATGATAHYERGVALEASDPVGAMAAYHRALAGLPAFADAHNNLGRLHHDAGRLGDAESHYRLALCVDRTVSLYWFNLGVALEDQRRNAEAIAAYEQAVALDPRCADAHFNLARLHEVIGRCAGDVLEIQRAVRYLIAYKSLMRAS